MRRVRGSRDYELRIRPRRLRMSPALRNLVSETDLNPSHFILPVFVDERLKVPKPVQGLRDYTAYPPEDRGLVELIASSMDLGVKAFLIFGIPAEKDERGSRAYSPQGPVQRALRYIRRELGWEPVIFTDLCICNYTTHGHCGLPKESRRGAVIDNDSTLEVYAKIAVSQAEAGSDFIAPSGMMDGQVEAIRKALDSEGFSDVGIMSYSVKYASEFYGPFREVMDSSPRFGDRRSYQMDPRNAFEALKEVELDIEEGADIVMVKPALPYLDVIRLVKLNYPEIPLAAYNVSGEYAMIKELSRAGLVNEPRAIMEVLYSIRRAGADIIITYHALDAAKVIKEGTVRF